MSDLIYRYQLPFLGVWTESCMYIPTEGVLTAKKKAKLVNSCARKAFISLGVLPKLQWVIGKTPKNVEPTKFNIYVQNELFGRRRVLALLPEKEGMQSLHALAQEHPAFRIRKKRSIVSLSF